MIKLSKSFIILWDIFIVIIFYVMFYIRENVFFCFFKFSFSYYIVFWNDKYRGLFWFWKGLIIFFNIVSVKVVVL